MAAPIQRIGIIAPVESPRGAAPAAAPTGGPDFGDTLANVIGDAAKAEKAADEASSKFAAGDPGTGIHEVMIAAEKAHISVRYAVTLKNKLLEAYRELMNTQL